MLSFQVGRPRISTTRIPRVRTSTAKCSAECQCSPANRPYHGLSVSPLPRFRGSSTCPRLSVVIRDPPSIARNLLRDSITLVIAGSWSDFTMMSSRARLFRTRQVVEDLACGSCFSFRTPPPPPPLARLLDVPPSDICCSAVLPSSSTPWILVVPPPFPSQLSRCSHSVHGSPSRLPPETRSSTAFLSRFSLACWSANRHGLRVRSRV